MSNPMKTPAPNNFPRDGEHNTVTAAGVEQMEREASQPNMTLDYTIGGTIEAEVHASIEAERIYAINRGHSILNQAANDLRREVERAARKPMTLDFEQIKGEAQAYLAASSHAQAHERGEAP